VDLGTDGHETQADRQRRASSFGAAATQYAEHRPTYAEAAIRWCLAPVSGALPARVADLGAGTGILTAALVELGADVIAVEPDQAMLAELRRRLPAVRSVEGKAEALPLPERSVDAVLCGQAMHWFDMARALPEIARVLTPGGVLAGLWNVADDRVSWAGELAAIRNFGVSSRSARALCRSPRDTTSTRTSSAWDAQSGPARTRGLLSSASSPHRPPIRTSTRYCPKPQSC
jgi:SAM-dependent methyltransferase